MSLSLSLALTALRRLPAGWRISVAASVAAVRQAPYAPSAPVLERTEPGGALIKE